MKKNLVLLGMMAVGKTTLGKIVAKKQKLEFVDTDSCIEKKNSMTIDKIFKAKGEKFFRMEEEKEVLKTLQKKNCVISLGGGAFMNKTLRDNILKDTISIWLDADIRTLGSRVKWNRNRPLLNEKNYLEKLRKLYAERKSTYKLADHKIECNKLTKSNIVEKIIALYEKY